MYINSKQFKSTTPWIVRQSENQYASDERVTETLCHLIKIMDPSEVERIIYNAHDPVARDLANWWEKHQEIDRQREERESQEFRNKQLRRSALQKLTADERKALDITW